MKPTLNYRECWNNACPNAVAPRGWLCAKCWERVPAETKKALRAAIKSEDWSRAVELQAQCARDLEAAAA